MASFAISVGELRVAPGGTSMNVMLHPVPVPDLAARFIAKPLQLLIGDAWVNAKSG